MKIKVILLIVIVIFFSAGDGYGQITEDKFNASVNYFNCKMIEYSIKKSENGTVADFKKNCDCNSKPDLEKIKRCINPEPKPADTIALADEINTMKDKELYSEWKTKDATEFFSSETFANYPKLDEFIRDKKGAEFNNLTKEINTQLLAHLQSKTITPPQSKTNITLTAEAKGTLQEDSGWWTMVKVGGIFTLLVLLLITLKWWEGIKSYLNKINNLVKKNKSSSQRLSDNSQKSTEDKTKTDAPYGSIEYLKSQDKLNQKKITDLERDVKKLKVEISALTGQKEEISALKVQIKMIEDRLPPPPQTPPWNSPQNEGGYYGRVYEEKRQPQKVFYLPTPNPDGSFDESQSLAFFKEGTSIFRLTQNYDGNWTFQLEDISQGLWYPDSNIKPVCESINVKEEGMKGIRTITPGTAQLINGKWKLVDKAKIEYVN